jgi:FkbM family methyltransferase
MRTLIKKGLTTLVDAYARLRRFSFPTKYTWRWKWEALTNRYEKETTDLFLELLRPGMTVIDVGAHIGYFTRICAERVGRDGHIYAFEADAENYSLLKRNTAAYANVTLVPLAVSSHTGNIDFYHLPESTGCHSTLAPEGASVKSTVPATTLDLFIGEKVRRPVDLIKMDIEGGEWEALKGMTRVLAQERLSLIIEWNPESLARGGIDPLELLSQLIAYRFDLFAITPGARIPLSASALKEAYAHLQPGGSVNIYCRK